MLNKMTASLATIALIAGLLTTPTPPQEPLQGENTVQADCNQVGGSYTLDGSQLTIGQSISTMMACAEPEGIIEQEQEYLAALGTAATYQITGDRLEMRTGEGATVVTFMAAK